MEMVDVDTIDYAAFWLGLASGAGAVSLALYIQAIYRQEVPKVYTLMLYVIGTLIILLHLEPNWSSPYVGSVIRLLGWSSLLIIELAIFYDIHTQLSRFRALMNRWKNEIGERMTDEEDET